MIQYASMFVVPLPSKQIDEGLFRILAILRLEDGQALLKVRSQALPPKPTEARPCVARLPFGEKWSPTGVKLLPRLTETKHRRGGGRGPSSYVMRRDRRCLPGIDKGDAGGESSSTRPSSTADRLPLRLAFMLASPSEGTSQWSTPSSSRFNWLSTTR